MGSSTDVIMQTVPDRCRDDQNRKQSHKHLTWVTEDKQLYEEEEEEEVRGSHLGSDSASEITVQVDNMV